MVIECFLRLTDSRHTNLKANNETSPIFPHGLVRVHEHNFIAQILTFVKASTCIAKYRQE